MGEGEGGEEDGLLRTRRVDVVAANPSDNESVSASSMSLLFTRVNARSIEIANQMAAPNQPGPVAVGRSGVDQGEMKRPPVRGVGCMEHYVFLGPVLGMTLAARSLSRPGLNG